jgi:hypothetical protein
MGRALWLSVFLLGVATALLVAASEQEEPAIWRYWGSGKLVSGEWAFDLSGTQRVLADEGPVTGFAFGPGREEVAYCGPATREDRSGLWVVSASRAYPAVRVEGKFWGKTTAPRRLLWTAPEGVTLWGPVSWAPDGSRIAVRAFGSRNDMVIVDYLGGAPVWLSGRAMVVDTAWHPRGEHIAYVTGSGDERAVWVQPLPPEGPPQHLGEGGYDLRWSVDGNTLRWLSPTSETVWTERVWAALSGEVSARGQLPARPADAIWSPDGRLCAVLEERPEGGGKEVVLYPVGSMVGERADLPGARPRELLCWSPDSRLVIVLSGAGFMLAVGARPPAYTPLELARPSREFSSERAAILGYPIDADAGAPVWSSDGKMVAYVMAQQFDEETGLGPPPRSGAEVSDIYSTGCLVVTEVEQERLEPVGPLREEVRTVLGNMQVIAESLQMYLGDYDRFPMSGNAEELRLVLAEYVEHLTSEPVFMRPGTEDEAVLRYLVEPGTRLAEVEDWQEMPVAVADYLWDYDVVVFADGRVELFRKTGAY